MALAQLSSTGVFSARFSAAPLRSTRQTVSLWPWLPYVKTFSAEGPFLLHNITVVYSDEFAQAELSSADAVSASRTAGVVVRAERASWLPGAELPSYLTGELPGDFGFDPLRLGENKEALQWYQQAELQNGRWAMLAAAGILFEDVLGHLGLGGPAARTPWYDAGKFEYFAPASTLTIIEFFLFAWVEFRRYQDMKAPGSTNQDPIFSQYKLPDGNEPGYPGGIFDPLGYSKGNMEVLKTKEIKNARLAMLGVLGFFVQAQTTHKTPLDNLSSHLANPWTNNVFGIEHARLIGQ